MIQPSLTARAKARLRKIPGYRLARLVVDLFKGNESRNAALLLLSRPRGLFQPFGTTSADRYPEIFNFVRDRLEDSPGVRILSFGCSTGEEVFTLRRYFPRAAIKGIDISSWNIAVCRRRLSSIQDDRILFEGAGNTSTEADASYDAVFAMAVYRHGDLNISPPPAQCDHRIRFVDFAASVTDLARILKPDGMLVIKHAMFRFADVPGASRFDLLFRSSSNEREPLYGMDNRLLTLTENPGVVFQKSNKSPQPPFNR